MQGMDSLGRGFERDHATQGRISLALNEHYRDVGELLCGLIKHRPVVRACYIQAV